MPNRFRLNARRLALASMAVSIAALTGCVSTAHHPAVRMAYPSPLAGPGAPLAGRAVEHAVAKGFAALEAGRPGEALAMAQRAAPSVAADVLKAQAKLAADPGEAEHLLRGVVERAPGYAAAWLTLSVAAERNGDEKAAFDAARRGAALWNAPRWRERLAALHDRWITRRLAEARTALAAGDADRALDQTAALLELDPANIGAHVLKARALLRQGHPAEARAALERIRKTPEVIAMLGRIAEREHRWSEAMRLDASLPVGFPGRREALERAKNRWRISNLPAYVGAAIDAQALTRAQLAVLIVDLVPQVSTMAAGPAPVLPDIVGLPEQREIITAVRAGFITADTLEHRFFPARQVTPATVRKALSRLAHVLGGPAPHWCETGDRASGCIQLGVPVEGHAVFQAMMPLLEQGGPR